MQLRVAVLAVGLDALLEALPVAPVQLGDQILQLLGAVGRSGSDGRVGWERLGASRGEGDVIGDGARGAERGGAHEDHVEIKIHGDLMMFYVQQQRSVKGFVLSSEWCGGITR